MSDVQDVNVTETEQVELNPVELKDTITIAGKEFKIKPLNAGKTAGISNIIGRLLLSGKTKLKEFKGLDAKELPTAILFALDENMLVKFASVLIGSDEEFARENFELSWVVEALAIQVRVSDLEAIMRNFTLLVSQIQ